MLERKASIMSAFDARAGQFARPAPDSALASTPPKPKPLQIAKFISKFRAWFATKSIPSPAGSGALN
jgi:hypothetical protein